MQQKNNHLVLLKNKWNLVENIQVTKKKTFSSILDVYREGSKRMLRGPSLILKKLQFWETVVMDTHLF